MDTTEILSSIRNSGFTNPIAAGISSALGGFSVPTLPDLTAIVNAQATAQSVATPAAYKIEAAQAAMASVYNSIQSLLGHTDRISGVNLSGNGTLATIAKTMESARSINGDKSCSTVLAAFGAITNAASMIQETLTALAFVQNFMNNTIAYIDAIPATAAQLANVVQNQIASDVAALAQAQLDVIQQSVATTLTDLIQDECAGAIVGAVMTQPLRNAVETAKQKIIQNRITAIKGYK